MKRKVQEVGPRSTDGHEEEASVSEGEPHPWYKDRKDSVSKQV